MNASELRAKAKESLTGRYWYAVLVSLVAGLLGALLESGAVNVNINTQLSEKLGQSSEIFALIFLVGGLALAGLSFAQLVLGGVVQLGYARYLLKEHDREVTDIKELFTQFDRFGQGFLQLFLRNLFTFLWGLLLVVPGIIKSLSYAMTPFIMAEHPEMSAKEAISASCTAMNGHKWELFCLSFSFIGWQFLAALTFGIGSIFLNPYINAAYAAFYRDKIAPKTLFVEAIPQIDVTQ